MSEEKHERKFDAGPPPSYSETLKIDHTNSVDFLNANDSLFFEGSNLDIDMNGYALSKDAIDSEHEIILQHDEFIKRQLSQNYPLLYVITDSLLMTFLNIILITLQIIAVMHNAALSHMGSAIWAGVYNLVTVILVISTIKYKNPTLMKIATTMKLFGMIISFGGFILVNTVAFYHYNCLAVSYYRPCYNKNMKPVHYTIIILGIPCMILSLAFFIYFQFKLMVQAKFNSYKSNQSIQKS